MSRVFPLAALCLLAAGCDMTRPADLSKADAAKILSAAPEFNRYARLVKIVEVDRMKAELQNMSFAPFMFHYLNSPSDAAPMEGKADFRYIKGQWYLDQFDYNCPVDCHIVYVHDGPEKHH